jgi:hypothetical protein
MLKKFLNWLKALFGLADKHPAAVNAPDGEFEFKGWIPDDKDPRDQVVSVTKKAGQAVVRMK